MSDNKFILSGLILLLIWTGLIVLAPFLIASNTTSLNYLGSAVYFFMDPVCHQLPQRSIYLASIPMPVCARCFSIYLSGVFVFLWQFLSKKRNPWSFKIYIFLAIPVALEIIVEKIGLYHNFFETRMLSGVLLGIIIFKLLIESFVREKQSDLKVDQ
jgi:uncharacterized membrane protein